MKEIVRPIVRSIYQIQKLRVQIGNRIVANFRVKLGIASSDSEDQMDKEGKDIMERLRLAYKQITDGIADGFAIPTEKKFKASGLISEYAELIMVATYMHMRRSEDELFKRLEGILNGVPIYSDFMKNVSGLGPAMAGVILSEIDIHKAKYPSSLWRYAGLDVGEDGRGRSRRKEHLRDVTYSDREGKQTDTKGITFNPFLKTKLVGVLGSSFVKQSAARCEYRKIYDDYKFRLQNRPDLKDETKARIHNMAIRYSVKRFLVDLYNVWRVMENLPCADEYSVAKLGIVHGDGMKEAA